MGAGVRVEAMTAAHLTAAAELLAGRHRADRGREPELPAVFEGAEAALELLRRGFEADGASGVVAWRDGQLIGYLLGATAYESSRLRPRASVIDYGAHAVAPGQSGVYRPLYAALAARWVGAGSFAHYVQVAADDRSTLRAWRSLGFGSEHATGLRHLTPPRAEPPDAVVIRRGGLDDAGTVGDLAVELHRYHANAPIFDPYLPEAVAGMRPRFAASLVDDEVVVWLAERDGRAVGMLIFGEPSGWRAMITPERSTHLMEAFVEGERRGMGAGRALLARALGWAREAGYARCTVSWVSANVIGAAFWLSMGFRPVAYRLCRVVDERVAWAHGR